MLITCSQKYIHTAENNTIKAYNAKDLTLSHMVSLDGVVSSLCSDTIVVAGTGNGSLYTVAAGKPMVLRQFKSPISALFLKGSILGVGTECGTVCVSLIRDTELAVLEEREHGAPVLGIITDGVTTYISDMRNRICMFPSRKVYDNFNTHMCYSKYLFASESVLLYCKTNEAFAVYLKHAAGTDIQAFMFNKTGSVLFIKDESKVFVYDFNKREVVNEIYLAGDFVYDEERNRFVVLRGRELATVDNVADRDLLRQSMNDIFFKESKIEERIVWSESECSDETLQITRKKNKSVNVSYAFVSKDTSTTSPDAPVAQRRGKGKKDKAPHPPQGSRTETQPVQKTCLNSLFEDASSSEQQMHIDHVQGMRCENTSIWPADRCEVPCKREPFMPSSVRSNDSHLMCYNTLGYLMSTRDEFFSLVELRYHDNQRNSMRIKDTNFCTLGVFADGAVLLATVGSLHFYSESIEWTHKSTEDVALVSISEAILGVVYNQGVLRIYKHSGLELFNCEFGIIDSICCSEKSVVVLCGNVLCRVNSATFTCEKFDVIGCASWIYANDHIYYRVANKVYVLRNGLSLKVAVLENVPLCVYGEYLLALSDSVRLYPEPVVEYFKIRLEHNSSCPNILNFVVFSRDESQIIKVAEDVEEQGKTRIADDVRSLLACDKRVMHQEGAELKAVGMEEGIPGHYRKKENEKWVHVENSDDPGLEDNKPAVFSVIKTTRYNAFKK